MEQKFYFFILLIILINTNFTKEQSCQKIECSSSLPNDICIKVESLTSLFQECPAGKVCAPNTDDPIEDAKCIDSKPNNFKRLPSLPCEQNENCLSGEC